VPRVKRVPRLGRLRRRVQILNSIYGLLVQGVDGLCVRVLDLEREQHRRERDIQDELDQEVAEVFALIAE
jgi:vacuolar-type H+-ATPase subunit D/Vma8